MKDEILIRYINKHCTATEEKEILEWLKEKDNRQRLFELEQIWGLKAEMRFSDKGRMDEAYRQLSRQLGLSGQIEKREKPVQRFTIGEWWKYAAVLVTVCLFATNLFYITKEEPEAYNTVVVPKGQRVSLLLSDGTTVWLNAESRFSYPAKFSEKYRTVTLEGEGYFEVAHNPKCPFTVKLPMLNIRVLGTKYYTVSDGLVLIRNSAQANVDSWTTGDLRFDNKTLKEMAKVIERRYDVKIRIMDSSLVEEYFTCHFRKDLTIAQAMELLKETRRVDYRIEKKTVYLYKK